MNTLLKNNFTLTTLIALIAAIIFIPFIGNSPLFDWDEINFAECAREMVVTGNYSEVQINFQQFWEKPPLFIWMQAASMNIFGVNEFSARFPNAICSIVSLIMLFRIGKHFHSPKFGLVWCVVYASTMLPHLFFKSGIIDPWFNLFIFVSLYNIIIFSNNANGRKELLNALFAGISLGLAVLTKGPAALLIIALTILAMVVWTKNFKLLVSKTFLVFSFFALLTSLSWFIFEYLRGNEKLIKEFITYQIRLFETGDAGHDGPFYYHIAVLLLGCFPASFIFIAGYRNKENLTTYQLLFRKFVLSLFWVVLILFSIVKTKIVHYSSLCYFPLTFITTLALVQNYQNLKFTINLKIPYWIVTIAITIAFIAISFINLFKNQLIQGNLIDDKFAQYNLMADVKWSGFEFLVAILFLASALLVYFGIIRQKLKLVYYGFGVGLLFIYFSINILVPKIEQYTQQASIDFYRQCAKHNCYVETHRFKSYAYLFYSNRMPGDFTNPDQVKDIAAFLDNAEKTGKSRFSSYPSANYEWMIRGKIDRPAYLVAKKTDEKEVFTYIGVKKLYDKNGYSFFVRMPAK